MDLALTNYFSLLCVMVILPQLCSSQYTYVSRATYYGSPDCLGTPSGACGFGEYGRNVNNGEVSGVSRLYRNGTGCGACYQVRCKVPQYCTDEGTKVVVTDYGEGGNTDFILSVRAYARMARPNAATDLFSLGVVDVEYKRVPCYYSNEYIKIKIHEHSRYPEYLALVVLYTAGLNDITAMEIWQEDCKEWKPMRKAFGAVWDMANPPRGPLLLKVQVTGSYSEMTWVQLPKGVPNDWKAGATYDTQVQLT